MSLLQTKDKKQGNGIDDNNSTDSKINKQEDQILSYSIRKDSNSFH